VVILVYFVVALLVYFVVMLLVYSANIQYINHINDFSDDLIKLKMKCPFGIPNYSLPFSIKTFLIN